MSHSTDNVTQQHDIDDGKETEDYNVTRLFSVFNISDDHAQSTSNSEDICNICWSILRAKVVFSLVDMPNFVRHALTDVSGMTTKNVRYAERKLIVIPNFS